jgi:hypothetical protein
MSNTRIELWTPRKFRNSNLRVKMLLQTIISVVPAIVGVLYALVGIAYLFKQDWPWAVVWLSYSLANFGLIAVGARS